MQILPGLARHPPWTNGQLREALNSTERMVVGERHEGVQADDGGQVESTDSVITPRKSALFTFWLLLLLLGLVEGALEGPLERSLQRQQGVGRRGRRGRPVRLLERGQSWTSGLGLCSKFLLHSGQKAEIPPLKNQTNHVQSVKMLSRDNQGVRSRCNSTTQTCTSLPCL